MLFGFAGLVKTENSENLESSTGATDLNKMKIVLELSNQISEQTDKIKELEKSLSDKDKTIEELRRNSSASIKPDALKYLNRKSDSGDILKASYEGDVESVQTESLKKLSVGLSHYDKAEDSNVYKFRDESSDEEELRGLSGASRDSGIGSGKKNGRNSSVKKPASRLSTLSDSDWETDDYPMTNTKIRSAPPEKQAKRVLSRVSSISTKTISDGEDDGLSMDDNASVTSSGKKKKSSVLRKHSGKSSANRRTPVASVAFESTADYPSRMKKPSKNSFFLTQSISPDSTSSGIPVS